VTALIPSIALSVRQPWAWAIIHAGKDIENRSVAAVGTGMWLGHIAIHAARGMTRAEYEDAREFMALIGVKCPHPCDLTRGAIIGSVTVTAVVEDSDSPWFFGPRGLVLAHAEGCEPIPTVGALGYFRWAAGGEMMEPKPWMHHWPDTGAWRPSAPSGKTGG